MSTIQIDAEEIALEVLNAFDTGESIQPFSARGGPSLADAYGVTAAIRGQREARGETHAGRKIGFTNRTIWPIYNVDGPIWGDMWDRTVFNLTEGSEFSVDGLHEPRIEPEIAFCLARSPEPGMDDATLLACCEWVAHCVEIVQSPYPGWKFQAPDTVCAGGLHGALLLAERRVVTPDLLGPLGGFTCTLMRDGVEVETGSSENVLGGPLKALSHLVGLLAGDEINPPLGRGEIITTGTLTDAYPIARGESWSTRLQGFDLPPVSIAFV
ncbi:MAG: hydratase [Pseudomonadota bacterium]